MVSEFSYIIITPARDEEEHIEKTLQAMVNQTIKPVEWMIVNDGSSDHTAAIIDKYRGRYSWISVVHRTNRGFRKAGGGVVEAFYEGYRMLKSKDADFIVKLDSDLSFDNDYFERCFEHFVKNPKLGIGGGAIYHDIRGVLKLEKGPLFHVRGATKIYRMKCWEDIGGLIGAPGWDTLDEVKANMLGWETRSFLDLRVKHHRYTGKANGKWRNLAKNGVANYISGYHPIFMALKCIRRIFQRPYFIGSLALFYGYISGYLKKLPRVEDQGLIQFLRREQIKRLLFKESIWK